MLSVDVKNFSTHKGNKGNKGDKGLYQKPVATLFTRIVCLRERLEQCAPTELRLTYQDSNIYKQLAPLGL
ncbi:MAG: hypothetical protein RL660_51 [Bacteroidota bacterium]|jgi:hypothetical protein